jgi:outer membrane immunogenic protein
MKRLLLVAVSLMAVAASGGANAADLPVYTKAPKAPVYNWTGFYIGAEGGAGWGNAQQTDGIGFNSGTYQPNGAFVGGTIGYNWQLYSNWVWGLEGDASWADIGATTGGTDPTSSGHAVGATGNPLYGCGGGVQQCQTKIENIDSVRARVGYAFGYVMPYVTGGLAIATVHGEEGDVKADGAFGSGTSTIFGWTAGAGVEAQILPRWTVKLEGLYNDFGNQNIFNDTISGKGVVAESVKLTPSLIKIGVNYKIW